MMESDTSYIKEHESTAEKTDKDCANQPDSVSFSSYGIEIDREKIKCVPLNEQNEVLKDLGVSAYEQEEFEEGVLQQVDSAIEEREWRIAVKAAQKNVQNVKDEIRTTQEEIEKAEKAIAACEGPASEDSNVRRGLISLRSHRETKVKHLQRLEAREKYALKDLDNILSKRRSIESKTTHSLADINFGIADFDPENSIGLEPDSNKPSTSYQELEQYYIAETVEYDNKYDRIKSRKRRIDIQQEFSDSYSSSEEYIPYPDEVSDELSEDDYDITSNIGEKVKYPVEKKRRKTKVGRHHKELQSNLKSHKNSRPKKVVDDGDAAKYLQRMRDLKMKEKLTREGRVDVVASDISEEEEDDRKEVALKGGFALSVRMWRKLYKYQRTGIKWLWELHCQEVGGILGDEMGLGKTIQIVSFLTGLWNLKKEGNKFGPVLIAAPATVLHQWVKEFHKWSPEFRVAILHDSGSFTGRKESLIKHIVNDNGVMVTSYSTLRIMRDELILYAWEYVILDEGHKIRNPDADITLSCKQFATPHRLILSGSPLQNNLKELWSLFDFIYPGKLGTLPVFMAEFSVPITLGGYANATDVQVQTAYKCACVLRDTISPYLLRRLKKDVKMSIQLPTKNEQVLFCRLTQEQRDLYKRYINSRDVASILAGKMKVFPGLIMLRKICNHPDLSSSAGSLDWMKASKQAAEADRNSNSQLNETGYDNGYGFWNRSGKLIVVESLLKLWKEQNHRVLLFSQTKQMLDILETFVKLFSYTYLRMDGTTSIGSRQPVVEKFNNDKSIFIFLLTTRVGGLGINLIGADRVIIFDPDWNPSTDTQARERSWRIGQDKHVTIYRLLTTGTIEEKIYHRQIFKQFLTNRVLKNPAQRRFFKSNDLYELFTLGDEGPRNNTETSAIFAGTGSEIKLGPEKSSNEGQSSRGKDRKQNRKKPRKIKPLKKVEIVDAKILHASSTLAHDHMEKEGLRESDERRKSTSSRNVWAIGDVDLQDEPQATRGNAGELDDNKSKKDRIEKDESKDTITLESFACKEYRSDEIDEGFTMKSGCEIKDPFEKNQKSLTINEAKVKSQKKKKRKIRNARVEGKEIKHLDKQSLYRDENSTTAYDKEKSEEDILLAIFDQTGVHSALKHDKIEESGNPDYVLVEKEAARVAKQAAEALRRSREMCRNVRPGVPTWTGNNGMAGLAIGERKPRFGAKRKAVVQNREELPKNAALFDGSDMIERNSVDSDDTSSASLLMKMRARKALAGRDTGLELDHNQYSVHGNIYGAKDTELIKEIRHFVALRAKNPGQATTQEIISEFKGKVDDRNNALFKEMLKQVCVLRKVNGEGIWFLKDDLS